jgi:hypothetical protein
MKWRKPKPALTLKQLAMENLLTQLTELQVGQSVVLKNLAGHGAGGLMVERCSKDTLVFQRTASKAGD